MPTKSKRVTWVVIVGLATLLIWLFATQLRGSYFSKGNLTVKTIDKQGVFVGDRSKVFTEKPKQIYQEINYVWDQIHMGNGAKKAGRLTEAVEYYKKAFDGLSSDMKIITPERGLGAKYLIETYENLGQYDEALEVLGTLDKKFYKGEYGLKESTEIRARLLAAKKKLGE